MNLIYAAMSSLFGIENIGLTIIIFTILIYICMFPLTYKQQKFAKVSSLMQPEIKAVQAKYQGKKDQASMTAMQQETTMIYDKYGVSPTGSCGYMLISFPILLALYRVIYNVPAYVSSVKNVFLELANGIMGVDGYKDIMTELVSEVNLSGVSVDFTATDDGVIQNYIIDVLNKLSSSNWDTLSEKFSSLSSIIDTTQVEVSKMDYFLGLNIADSPLSIIQSNWANGSIYLTIAAALVPILSYLGQVLNMKMMPSSATDGNDQMARQMKTMNTMMPLMSLFFCFTLPVGVGLYWTAGAFIRTAQQYALNRHWKNVDMDKIIEENREKLKKKREKMGISENQINNAAKLNTRRIENGAKISTNDSASKEEQLQRAADARSKAKAGSLSAKANLVKEFNEKNNK
ncbi:MAG: YidC/Oxa1 family membrane protein insertase [Lachnospiraceae bacterium]|nr:YidC/Oxa1 family membrane protein insertase [Lachnospiraceae bacterium]